LCEDRLQHRRDRGADALFNTFLSGGDVRSFPPKCLQPVEDGVWELRTHDLRFFGWFWRRGVFVTAEADTKANASQMGMLAIVDRV
jgi:hypothetical protein